MTEDLKIPAVSPRVHYIGNGVQTVFTYPFPIFADENIRVMFDAAPVVSGYSVNGEGDSAGGEITFATAPADGVVVTIERVLPLSRVTDFIEGGSFSAESINNELDYLTALVQQVDNETQTMLRYPATELPANAVLPSKSVRAGRAFAFDADGNPTAVDINNVSLPAAFIADGTGAVTRTMTEKAKDIVSVKDFGAIGDGVANDTTAIKAALAAHSAVYVPKGIYRIADTIEIGEGQTLFGAGQTSIIRAANNSFVTVAVIAGYGSVFNLKIQNGLSGVKCYGKNAPCIQNNVRNVTIDGAVTGILLDGYADEANPCNWNAFQNVVIKNPTLNGIHLNVSGSGAAPKANKFFNVQIDASASAITGQGVYVQYALFNNSFIDCDINVAGTAAAVFRVGAYAQKVMIINLVTTSTNSVPNIQLDAGSKETAITNLTSNSNGAAIWDLSGGDYLAYNAGSPDKNRLYKTRISDLTTEMQRYDTVTVALAGAGTVDADLAKSMILVNAGNGAVMLNVPTANSISNGATITIKKIDDSSNVVTVAEKNAVGPDGKKYLLGAQNDFVGMVCDGSAWRVIGSNVMAKNAFYYDGSGLFQPDLTRDLYIVSSYGGVLNFQLPPANAAQAIGRMVTIKKSDSSSNAVNVKVEGGIGPDNAIQALTAQYAAITVMSNGGAWYVISRHP